jgi:ABC-type Mn2+/Zn2+ transport system ATPase subunit
MGIGTKALLEIRGLAKSFPGVKALQSVDFTVRRGEVHGLMGENGAGKSTLIKVLTGVYPRDGGTIRLDGVEIDPRSPKIVEGLVRHGVPGGKSDPPSVAEISASAVSRRVLDDPLACRPGAPRRPSPAWI